MKNAAPDDPPAQDKSRRNLRKRIAEGVYPLPVIEERLRLGAGGTSELNKEKGRPKVLIRWR